MLISSGCQQLVMTNISLLINRIYSRDSAALDFTTAIF